MSSSEGGHHPGRIGVGDGPGEPCRAVGVDFARTEAQDAADYLLHQYAQGAHARIRLSSDPEPLVTGHVDADGVLHIDSAADALRDQVTRWAQAMTPAFQEFHEQMRRTVEAIGVSLRPLAEFLEQHPELRNMQPEPPVQGCHHLCGRWPEHECGGEATGTLAYRPGGREIPMCDSCREVTLAGPPRPILRGAERDWPADGKASTCAHVCGGSPDHVCDARATTTIRHPLPSGGTRVLPLCGPCAVAENAAATAARPAAAAEPPTPRTPPRTPRPAAR